MKKLSNQLKLLLLLFILGLIAMACGGGGGGVASTSLGGTGTGGTKAKVTGSIDAFGSIYVGGIRFTTEELNISIEGNSGNLNDLELGMWVEVEGTIDPNTLVGTATNLVYSTHHAGEIDVLGSDNTFQINDIVFTTDARTFVSYDLDSTELAVGMDISVTGTYLDNGRFRATYIGPNDLGFEFESSEEDFIYEFEDEFEIQSFFIEIESEIENDVFEAEGLIFDFTEAEDILGSGKVEIGDLVSVTGEIEEDIMIVEQYALIEEEDFEEDDIEDEFFGVLVDIEGSFLQIDDEIFFYNNFTYFGDESNFEDREFGPGKLEVGDFLEVYYRENEQSQNVLEYVIRIDEDEFEEEIDEEE